jgi:hypothetical protein
VLNGLFVWYLLIDTANLVNSKLFAYEQTMNFVDFDQNNPPNHFYDIGHNLLGFVGFEGQASTSSFMSFQY